MEQDDILDRIHGLVDEEHRLRERLQRGELGQTAEHEKLRQVENSLDQCWDLLRQRRARSDAGQDPEEAEVRSVDQVEGYQQ